MPERDTGTDQPSTTDALMADRYGRSARHTRTRWILVIGVVAIIGLTWLGWVAWHHANPEVRGELSSFDVVSDHEVRVVIDVKRSSSAAVQCTVQAQAASHGIVADQDVTIPAGSDEDVRFTTVVATEREATAVTVSNCH